MPHCLGDEALALIIWCLILILVWCKQLFKPIMTKVMERYDPDAIVFQSGADSLSGDRLGCFNLSIKGHAECLKFMTTFGKPMLVLGGGGYSSYMVVI